MKYNSILLISLFLIYGSPANAQTPLSAVHDSVVCSDEIFVIPIVAIRNVYPETATIEIKPYYTKMISRHVEHCMYIMIENSSLLVRRFPCYSSVRTKEPVVYIGGKRIRGATRPNNRMLNIVLKHLDENDRASIIAELTTIQYRIKVEQEYDAHDNLDN